jgi:hypothetical protein
MVPLLDGECQAVEPIVGWGKIRFGMSRQELHNATKSKTYTCDKDESTAPFECASEYFDQKVNGLEFNVTVDFMAGLGASRITLRSFFLNSEAISVFDQYKKGLSAKYGPGSQSSFISRNWCLDARQRWDRHEKVVNVSWLIRKDYKFSIVGDGGSIVMLLGEEYLCSNTPDDRVKFWVNSTSFPQYDLMFVYRKRDNKLPDPF